MSASNQFAATFLQEAAEQLALIEEIILEVESNPQNAESINRLFRVFHTVKGSGAMFGFDGVAGFTHHVETVLDCVRSGQSPVSKELVDVILAAKDHITALLRGPEGASPDQPALQARLISRLSALLPQKSLAQPGNKPPASPLPAAETPGATSAFHIRFRPEPAILTRGTDPAALLSDLRKLGPCLITAQTDKIPALEELTPDACIFFWDISLTTSQGVNAIKDVFIFVEDESEIVIEPLSNAAPLASCVPNASPNEAPDNPASPVCADTNPRPGAGRKSGVTGTSTATGESVRVPSDRLDRLVNLVGELVINQSRLSQISGRLNEPGLAAPTEDLERLVAELRDIVLGIRMMPIGGTFNKFKRLVRDLSDELGKEIDLVTQGEDTELDKTVIDNLGDPLVHLIRNAIDHGIGTPEERLGHNKPRRGTLRLAARYEGANVVISIEDDGRGLDKHAIHAKAIEKNLVSTDKELSDNELFKLILLPGFSTAKVVSNLSGRGVGMDVVKRQIDALRGSVEITSQPGRGTCISLTLPLTLAIIDGLLVEVNQEQFILPMSSVRENVELSSRQRATMNGRNLLTVRGELVPYLRLRDIFKISGDEQELERVVIVSLGGNRIGLVVDRVVGSRQTVIQSLGRFYRDTEVFSGATIMGDGRVALILDVAGLLRHSDQLDSSI